MFRCNVNETRAAYITVEDNLVDGANVTVSTATFEVFNAAGASIQDSAGATIEDNGTALVYIHGDVDGSNLTADAAFKVIYTVTIGTQVVEVPVPSKAIETKL